MHLMRSICSLFGGKCTEDAKAAKEPSATADLGQKEAELERAGKEQMSHMKTGSKQRPRRSNEFFLITRAFCRPSACHHRRV